MIDRHEIARPAENFFSQQTKWTDLDELFDQEQEPIKIETKEPKQEETNVLKCPRCSHGTLSLIELDLEGNRIYTCVGENDDKVSISTYCCYPFDDNLERYDSNLTPEHFIVSDGEDPKVKYERLKFLLKPIRKVW